MRLLLDNNLSPKLAGPLIAHGYDVVHVRDRGLQRASDAEVLTAARDDGRVLVSADTDFGTLLARSGDTAPSVVLIRRSRGRRTEDLARLIADNLGTVTADLNAGAIVVLTDADMRIRRLPIPPGH
jgi:predicted nuclease of predicted toxin-antitoxin system